MEQSLSGYRLAEPSKRERTPDAWLEAVRRRHRARVENAGRLADGFMLRIAAVCAGLCGVFLLSPSTTLERPTNSIHRTDDVIAAFAVAGIDLRPLPIQGVRPPWLGSHSFAVLVPEQPDDDFLVIVDSEPVGRGARGAGGGARAIVIDQKDNVTVEWRGGSIAMRDRIARVLKSL
jgi:hypothetical protein